MTITPEGGARTLSDLIAEEIRVALTRKRMSQRQFATRLGVSTAWLNYRLTGTQEIGVNDLKRIADALGVGVYDLLPTADEASRAASTPVVAGESSRRSGGRSTAIAHYCGTAERTSDRTPRVTRAPGHPPIARVPTGSTGRTAHVLRVPACTKRSSQD